ncbi:MAG: hypothetical protein NTY19_20040 [Planctomycetota bacterium]|nr:hypothetical protein [Planctomycetota bacterium]
MAFLNGAVDRLEQLGGLVREQIGDAVGGRDERGRDRAGGHGLPTGHEEGDHHPAEYRFAHD